MKSQQEAMKPVHVLFICGALLCIILIARQCILPGGAFGNSPSHLDSISGTTPIGASSHRVTELLPRMPMFRMDADKLQARTIVDFALTPERSAFALAAEKYQASSSSTSTTSSSREPSTRGSAAAATSTVLTATPAGHRISNTSLFFGRTEQFTVRSFPLQLEWPHSRTSSHATLSTAGVQTVTSDESLISFVVNPVVIHGDVSSTTVVVQFHPQHLPPTSTPSSSSSSSDSESSPPLTEADLDTQLNAIVVIVIEGVIGYRIPVWGGVVPTKHGLRAYVPGPLQSVSLDTLGASWQQPVTLFNPTDRPYHLLSYESTNSRVRLMFLDQHDQVDPHRVNWQIPPYSSKTFGTLSIARHEDSPRNVHGTMFLKLREKIFFAFFYNISMRPVTPKNINFGSFGVELLLPGAKPCGSGDGLDAAPSQQQVESVSSTQRGCIPQSDYDWSRARHRFGEIRTVPIEVRNEELHPVVMRDVFLRKLLPTTMSSRLRGASGDAGRGDGVRPALLEEEMLRAAPCIRAVPDVGAIIPARQTGTVGILVLNVTECLLRHDTRGAVTFGALQRVSGELVFVQDLSSGAERPMQRTSTSSFQAWAVQGSLAPVARRRPITLSLSAATSTSTAATELLEDDDFIPPTSASALSLVVPTIPKGKQATEVDEPLELLVRCSYGAALEPLLVAQGYRGCLSQQSSSSSLQPQPHSSFVSDEPADAVRDLLFNQMLNASRRGITAFQRASSCPRTPAPAVSRPRAASAGTAGGGSDLSNGLSQPRVFRVASLQLNRTILNQHFGGSSSGEVLVLVPVVVSVESTNATPLMYVSALSPTGGQRTEMLNLHLQIAVFLRTLLFQVESAELDPVQHALSYPKSVTCLQSAKAQHVHEDARAAYCDPISSIDEINFGVFELEEMESRRANPKVHQQILSRVQVKLTNPMNTTVRLTDASSLAVIGTPIRSGSSSKMLNSPFSLRVTLVSSGKPLSIPKGEEGLTIAAGASLQLGVELRINNGVSKADLAAAVAAASEFHSSITFATATKPAQRKSFVRVDLSLPVRFQVYEVFQLQIAPVPAFDWNQRSVQTTPEKESLMVISAPLRVISNLAAPLVQPQFLPLWNSLDEALGAPHTSAPLSTSLRSAVMTASGLPRHDVFDVRLNVSSIPAGPFNQTIGEIFYYPTLDPPRKQTPEDSLHSGGGGWWDRDLQQPQPQAEEWPFRVVGEVHQHHSWLHDGQRKATAPHHRPAYDADGALVPPLQPSSNHNDGARDEDAVKKNPQPAMLMRGLFSTLVVNPMVRENGTPTIGTLSGAKSWPQLAQVLRSQARNGAATTTSSTTSSSSSTAAPFAPPRRFIPAEMEKEIVEFSQRVSGQTKTSHAANLVLNLRGTAGVTPNTASSPQTLLKGETGSVSLIHQVVDFGSILSSSTALIPPVLQWVPLHNVEPYPIAVELFLVQDLVLGGVAKNSIRTLKDAIGTTFTNLMTHAPRVVPGPAPSRSRESTFQVPEAAWMEPGLVFTLTGNATSQFVIPPHQSALVGPITFQPPSILPGTNHSVTYRAMLVVRNNDTGFDAVLVRGRVGIPKIELSPSAVPFSKVLYKAPRVEEPGVASEDYEAGLSHWHFQLTRQDVDLWMPRSCSPPHIGDMLRHWLFSGTDRHVAELALHAEANTQDDPYLDQPALKHSEALLLNLLRESDVREVVIPGEFSWSGNLIGKHVLQRPLRSRQPLSFYRVIDIVNGGSFPLNVTGIRLDGQPAGCIVSANTTDAMLAEEQQDNNPHGVGSFDLAEDGNHVAKTIFRVYPCVDRTAPIVVPRSKSLKMVLEITPTFKRRVERVNLTLDPLFPGAEDTAHLQIEAEIPVSLYHDLKLCGRYSIAHGWRHAVISLTLACIVVFWAVLYAGHILFPSVPLLKPYFAPPPIPAKLLEVPPPQAAMAANVPAVSPQPLSTTTTTKSSLSGVSQTLILNAAAGGLEGMTKAQTAAALAARRAQNRAKRLEAFKQAHHQRLTHSSNGLPNGSAGSDPFHDSDGDDVGSMSSSDETGDFSQTSSSNTSNLLQAGGGGSGDYTTAGQPTSAAGQSSSALNQQAILQKRRRAIRLQLLELHGEEEKERLAIATSHLGLLGHLVMECNAEKEVVLVAERARQAEIAAALVAAKRRETDERRLRAEELLRKQAREEKEQAGRRQREKESERSKQLLDQLQQQLTAPPAVLTSPSKPPPQAQGLTVPGEGVGGLHRGGSAGDLHSPLTSPNRPKGVTTTPSSNNNSPLPLPSPPTISTAPGGTTPSTPSTTTPSSSTTSRPSPAIPAPRSSAQRQLQQQQQQQQQDAASSAQSVMSGSKGKATQEEGINNSNSNNNPRRELRLQPPQSAAPLPQSSSSSSSASNSNAQSQLVQSLANALTGTPVTALPPSTYVQQEGSNSQLPQPQPFQKQAPAPQAPAAAAEAPPSASRTTAQSIADIFGGGSRSHHLETTQPSRRSKFSDDDEDDDSFVARVRGASGAAADLEEEDEDDDFMLRHRIPSTFPEDASSPFFEQRSSAAAVDIHSFFGMGHSVAQAAAAQSAGGIPTTPNLGSSTATLMNLSATTPLHTAAATPGGGAGAAATVMSTSRFGDSTNNSGLAIGGANNTANNNASLFQNNTNVLLRSNFGTALPSPMVSASAVPTTPPAPPQPQRASPPSSMMSAPNAASSGTPPLAAAATPMPLSLNPFNPLQYFIPATAAASGGGQPLMMPMTMGHPAALFQPQAATSVGGVTTAGAGPMQPAAAYYYNPQTGAVVSAQQLGLAHHHHQPMAAMMGQWAIPQQQQLQMQMQLQMQQQQMPRSRATDAVNNNNTNNNTANNGGRLQQQLQQQQPTAAAVNATNSTGLESRAVSASPPVAPPTTTSSSSNPPLLPVGNHNSNNNNNSTTQGSGQFDMFGGGNW